MNEKSLGHYLEYWGPDEIHIKGHRIWIQDIVNSYNDGLTTVEQLLARYPTLTRQEVAGVLADYFAHKELLDAVVARHNAWVEEHERQADEHPDELTLRMRRLKAQWEQEGKLPIIPQRETDEQAQIPH